MKSRNNIYVKDRRYGKKNHRGSGPNRPILTIAAILIVLTVAVAAYRYWPEITSPGTVVTTTATHAQPATPTMSPTPTATPTPTPIPDYINRQLLPEETLLVQSAGTPADGCSPTDNNIVATVFDDNYTRLTDYSRSSPVSLLNPINYNQIPGVLTFRGNNFRSSPSFGLVDLVDFSMEQTWTNPVGSLKSSSWSFWWTGTGWTGQPLLVQWEDDVRQLMNISDEKKNKDGLVEVIYATLDGNIYFFDLDDGVPTRDPIHIGAPVKGTPCVDPRGYPILYVGQGDKNSSVSGIGFRVFSLIDQSLLLYKRTDDSNSYRASWGACDSSPILDAGSDTLIYPNENGMIYTAKMNTSFDQTTGALSIDPDFEIYRYKMTGLSSYGIESSIAIYDGYGYFSDNSGILNCVDLNTLQPIWSRSLGDDSDVTPLLDQTGEQVAVYTATEVDWQKNIIGNYLGSSLVYKLDAMTGEVLWQSSYDCWTKNAANNGDDINGGAMGSPIIGKQNMDGLVVFSFCMTEGIYSGNSVVAYHETDGSIAWEYEMNQYSWSSPVDVYDEDGNGYILIPDSIGQLHLIDGQTGERLEVIQLTRADGETSASNVESSIAVFGNQLVIGTRGNVIVGVTLK